MRSAAGPATAGVGIEEGGVEMGGAATDAGAVCCGAGASGGKVSDSIERSCDPRYYNLLPCYLSKLQ